MNMLKKGFTLIELLLVIAILSILLVVVFAALNPAQRLSDTRDARRWNDVNQILTAIHECIVDNSLTACGITNDGTTREIVNGAIATGCNAVCTTLATDDCEDLSGLTTGVGTNNTVYMGGLPTDPTTPATDHTSYTITTTSGIVTIASCGAEGSTISVSR